MIVVVDAMGAEFGGIRTYVEQLLRHWSSVHPEDRVHVVVPAGSTLNSAAHVRHELTVLRPGSIGRPIAQSLVMHRLVRTVGADAVLATMPATSLRRPACPLAVVVHDLRHELRPEQFTRIRRLMRRVSYGRSYRLADGFIAVSQRSLDDLHTLHPALRGTPAVVAHHGADHVLTWPDPSRTGPSVAFAHHTNKNPQLIIDAWAVLAGRGQQVPPLLIVGLSEDHRRELAAAIEARDLTGCITLAPFLPDADFANIMAVAEMIVFPSDFEGFGLPVVEGMTLGKPVVIGPDPATIEVAGGHAVVMAGWSAKALADAVTSARAMSAGEVAAARLWGLRFAWDTTVRDTREQLARLRR